MTTVAVPQRELGGQAWARLDALLRGEVPTADAQLVPVLQVRGSTGPPRVGR
jgi:LacI family transcriptional regulator